VHSTPVIIHAPVNTNLVYFETLNIIMNRPTGTCFVDGSHYNQSNAHARQSTMVPIPKGVEPSCASDSPTKPSEPT